jgi:hypothetical protein
MKCYFLFAVCFVLTVTAGCRKDVDEKIPQGATGINELSKADEGIDSFQTEDINVSKWQSGVLWNKVSRPTHTVFYSNFPVEISDDDIEAGLIRIFEASGAAPKQVRALPFEETVNGHRYYWYYFVKKNAIMVSVDVYEGDANPAADSRFQTVVFSKAAAESNEKARTDLMQLSYENISRLSNENIARLLSP